MPVRLRLRSKRTMSSRPPDFSVTVMGWPMAAATIVQPMRGPAVPSARARPASARADQDNRRHDPVRADHHRRHLSVPHLGPDRGPAPRGRLLRGRPHAAGRLGAASPPSPPAAGRRRAGGADCAKAVTGYGFGNVLISVSAGVVTDVGLVGFGVPLRGVPALGVGFADLRPLVGATLGAIPTVGVAFLHSI